MMHQQQSYQQFGALSAPGPQYYAQSGSQSYPQSSGFQPGQSYPNPQQGFQSTSQPQRQSTPTTQQAAPQQIQTIIGSQFCAPWPTTFYVKDKLLSWSGGDVTILDGQGGLAYTVDSKVMTMRGNRVLKDAAGNSVCAMKEKLMSLKNKWIICRGPHADDSLIVASVNKELFTMHHGVQAKLPGSDDVEYSLRAKGYIVGRREVDILHRGQAIGHVTRMMSGEAIFLDKQSYKVDLAPGYDHAFILCMVVIMDEYFHEGRR